MFLLEGHVVPYLKEVELAGNPSRQLQDTYVLCCVFTCVHTILDQCHMSSAQAYFDSRQVFYSLRAV